MPRRAVAASLLVAGALLGSGWPGSIAPATASSCSGWTSESTPPPTIRVFRAATGAVETVDFKVYAKNVLSREWIGSWTTESLRSGARGREDVRLVPRPPLAGADQRRRRLLRRVRRHPRPGLQPRPAHLVECRRGGGRHVGHPGAEEREHLPDLLQRWSLERGVRRQCERLADVPVGHAGLWPGRAERRPDPADLLLPRLDRDRCAGPAGAHRDAGADARSDARSHAGANPHAPAHGSAHRDPGAQPRSRRRTPRRHPRLRHRLHRLHLHRPPAAHRAAASPGSRARPRPHPRRRPIRTWSRSRPTRPRFLGLPDRAGAMAAPPGGQ